MIRYVFIIIKSYYFLLLQKIVYICKKMSERIDFNLIRGPMKSTFQNAQIYIIISIRNRAVYKKLIKILKIAICYFRKRAIYTQVFKLYG